LIEYSDDFCNLMLKYNKIHNITGAKTKQQIEENIEDSLYPLKYLHVNRLKKAIDIGTGAGFPGLILAMKLKDTHFSLFEPIAKKSAFLHLAKSTFNLQNVDIITKRVEEFPAFKADLITSRAVTRTQTLLELCKNFISQKSIVLLYKGSSVQDEIDKSVNHEIYGRGNRNYLILRNLNDN